MKMPYSELEPETVYTAKRKKKRNTFTPSNEYLFNGINKNQVYRPESVRKVKSDTSGERLYK
jgi:CRISPR/Cas system endoribonuclease Cas6 (RAMP superfamily)